MPFWNPDEFSAALLTDLYELTMASAYWKSGVFTKEAAFHLYFRRHPFQGGFTIACGLENIIRLVENFRFHPNDLEYLGGLEGADRSPLFDREFLAHLSTLRFTCDIDAIPEGTVVFPNEPLLRITGPIIECQLLETAFLTLINFETLIATKAARICLAAEGDPVIEFGLRRAQGIDGGVTASRAAFIGGCAGTSNVLAGKIYGIPVKGTHAHSWVMAFDSELESFRAYAKALPNNCVFLVDTYDTLQGVRNAIEVGQWLRSQGHKLLGIRLDSGDLAYLSIEARKLLDEAGFQDTSILASNDLDEQVIASLKIQGAMIDSWGVGTRLATAYDQPALGGVYKLSAIREPGSPWRQKVKISEQAIKVSTPGLQQVRRFEQNEEFIGDVVFDQSGPVPGRFVAVDPLDPTRRKILPSEALFRDLLVPVFRKGVRVYEPPSLSDSQARSKQELAGFHPGIKRFLNPHQYPVGLEQSLHELRTKLILESRGIASFTPALLENRNERASPDRYPE
jgi:nicotinate phosphoribosyltransferase